MNRLEHLQEFRELLANYNLSKASLRALDQTELVILAAPTSVGRNTILRRLIKSGDYHFVVSDTTRQPRTNDGVLEQNGREYWFRSEPEMLDDIKRGKFLEAAIIHQQQVSGISIRELETAKSEDKIAIADIEIAGAANAMLLKPDAVCIFVLPPSFEEWQRRLKHRGPMPADEYRRRMESAVKEFEASLTHDYYRFIINDSVESAVEQVNRIAKLDEIDSERQAVGRDLAEQLLISTQQILKA